MKHIGNLEITEKNQDQFKDLVEVTGYLYINGSAKLEAPALTTVGGDLSVNGSAKLDALTTVGGDLCINSSAKLDALTTVGGDLYINGSAKLDAPQLTTVGGGLYINGSAKLDAPQLTTVGGDLYIYRSAKLDALTTVGGYLYINSSAKLNAPQLKEHNNKEAKAICKKSLELSFSLNGFIKIDGILSWLIGQKTIGDISVFEIKIVGKLKNSFAVKRGGVYSHGETVEKAIEDLRYKLSTRDVSEFKSWDKNEYRKVDDLIQAYRSITGACEQGVKEFCNSIDLSKDYSIVEVLKLTDGKFGHNEFKGFFK